MMNFIFENWDKLLGFIIAIGGGYKYFDTRRRELAWKRTEFLFGQAALLDTDRDMGEAIQIIEGRHASITIGSLFKPNGDPDTDSQGDTWQNIDKLLNLLDRIAYSVLELKTLDIDEAKNFGWYLEKIENNAPMKKYCEKYGYPDIVKLSKKI
jgi:hypothetical protein